MALFIYQLPRTELFEVFIKTVSPGLHTRKPGFLGADFAKIFFTKLWSRKEKSQLLPLSGYLCRIVEIKKGRML